MSCWSKIIQWMPWLRGNLSVGVPGPSPTPQMLFSFCSPCTNWLACFDTVEIPNLLWIQAWFLHSIPSHLTEMAFPLMRSHFSNTVCLLSSAWQTPWIFWHFKIHLESSNRFMQHVFVSYQLPLGKRASTWQKQPTRKCFKNNHLKHAQVTPLRKGVLGVFGK